MINIRMNFLAWAMVLIPTAIAGASQIVRLDADITFAGGAWRFEGGKLIERSDGATADRHPLFSTFQKQQRENVVVTAEFELYDDAGQAFVCPSWIDPENYIAVVWVNRNELRIVQVRNGSETILARRSFDVAYKPLFKIGAAISRTGIRAFVDGEPVLDAAAYFAPSDTAAVGGRYRLVGFTRITADPVDPWETPVDQLCPLELAPVVGRRAFLRKEPGAHVQLRLRNVSDRELKDVRITSNVDVFPEQQQVPAIAPGESVMVSCPVPAERLRPDAYQLIVKAIVEGRPPAELAIPVHVAKRTNPDRLPVFLWDSVPVQGMGKLSDMGFNRVFLVNLSYEDLWKQMDSASSIFDEAEVAETMARLDEAMLLGLDGAISYGPGHFTAGHVPELRRINRDGTPQEKLNTCNFLSMPQQFAVRGAEQFMQVYGMHPAFKAALLNTEMRDGAQPCFHPEDIGAYRRAAGHAIPAEVTEKHGVSYRTIPGFPSDRIVEDDHPLLTYFRWYWKQGDSWVMLNNQIHQAIKSHGGRDDFITWFDPAVRVAPVYGSGGNLDMIGHWTYTYPDPVRIGMNADELINMARGKQKVFQMVQAIWYRSETAPKNPADGASPRNPWDDHDPDADYLTPSPAQLTEGIWTAISRPIDMIGYHGLGALLPGSGSTYNYTHADTASALERIHREVVQPLGPMLKQIGNRPADVAFLQSFTSQTFGGQGTNGWIGGDIGNCWLISQYAGLQSDMIFEETIVETGLDAYKVLILPACEVLPRSVFDAIVRFQKNGGILIGDSLLVPGLKPDYTIDFIPSGLSLEARETQMLESAMKIRAFLNGRYEGFALSANPKVVLHARQRDGVQYLFAINDEKEFGDYVGKYGRVKENGVPASSEITVQRSGVRIVDLIEQAEVPVVSDGATTRFTANLKPGSGAIYVISETLPARLNFQAGSSVRRGETIHFRITVVDDSGAAIAPAVPVDIQIIDPAFRPAEPSGAHVALNGTLDIPYELAENDRTGIWQATVIERMTGLKSTLTFKVD